MATDNTNMQNQAEVKTTEKLEIVISLNTNQAEALKTLEKLDEKNKLAQAALDARIKGAWKYFADKAEKALEAEYDKNAKRGFKHPLSKDEYMKQQMKRIHEISAGL